jgi:uncharacterized membrane protein YhaH (DUF805 family)
MTENPLQYQIRRAQFWQFWALLLGGMFVVALFALIVIGSVAHAEQTDIINRTAPGALGR